MWWLFEGFIRVWRPVRLQIEIFQHDRDCEEDLVLIKSSKNWNFFYWHYLRITPSPHHILNFHHTKKCFEGKKLDFYSLLSEDKSYKNRNTATIFHNKSSFCCLPCLSPHRPLFFLLWNKVMRLQKVSLIKFNIFIFFIFCVWMSFRFSFQFVALPYSDLCD